MVTYNLYVTIWVRTSYMNPTLWIFKVALQTNKLRDPSDWKWWPTFFYANHAYSACRSSRAAHNFSTTHRTPYRRIPKKNDHQKIHDSLTEETYTCHHAPPCCRGRMASISNMASILQGTAHSGSSVFHNLVWAQLLLSERGQHVHVAHSPHPSRVQRGNLIACCIWNILILPFANILSQQSDLFKVADDMVWYRTRWTLDHLQIADFFFSYCSLGRYRLTSQS